MDMHIFYSMDYLIRNYVYKKTQKGQAVQYLKQCFLNLIENMNSMLFPTFIPNLC